MSKQRKTKRKRPPAAAMLEVADAMSELLAACEAGNSDDVLHALEQLDLAPKDGRARGIVICSQVGQAPFVPRGSLTDECYKCHAHVWVSPPSYTLVESGAVRPICITCVEEAISDDTKH